MSSIDDKKKTLALVLEKWIKPRKRYRYENGRQCSRRSRSNSSGSLVLDIALGVGGYQRRVIENLWQESSGKTTLTMHAIAESQKQEELQLL